MNPRYSLLTCLFALGFFLAPNLPWANLERAQCHLASTTDSNQCQDCALDSQPCKGEGCATNCTGMACSALFIDGLEKPITLVKATLKIDLSGARRSEFYYLNPSYTEGLQSIWQPPKLS